jgi:hypothetical protein
MLWWAARPTHEGFDARPWWQRVAVFIGVRRDF